MEQPKLYLMLGFPGAGKTTTAEIVAKLTGAVHLASDKIRLEMIPEPKFTEVEHQMLYHEIDKRTEQLLRDNKSVIYDANLNRHAHRNEKYEICKRVGAKPVLLWVKTPRETARDRALHGSRQRLWPPGETPSDMFERLANVFELPADDEPCIELDGTKISEEYVKQKLGL